MDIPTTLLLTGTTVVATGGVAWGAVKQSLNGTRERVVKIEATQKALADAYSSLLQKAVSTETKVDMVLSRLDKQ